MNTLEERMNHLEERLIKLEKKEKRRETIAIIKTVLTIIILISMIIIGLFAYKRIKDTIEPITKITDTYNEGTDWLQDIEDYITGIK